MGRKKKLVNKKQTLKEDVGIEQVKETGDLEEFNSSSENEMLEPTVHVILALEKESSAYEVIMNAFKTWVIKYGLDKDIDMDNVIIDFNDKILFRKNNEPDTVYRLDFQRVPDSNMLIVIDENSLTTYKMTPELNKYFIDTSSEEENFEISEEGEEMSDWEIALNDVTNSLLGEPEGTEEIENLDLEGDLEQEEQDFETEEGIEANVTEEEVQKEEKTNEEEETFEVQEEEETEEELKESKLIKFNSDVENSIINATKIMIERIIMSGQMPSKETLKENVEVSSLIKPTAHMIDVNNDLSLKLTEILEVIYGGKE